MRMERLLVMTPHFVDVCAPNPQRVFANAGLRALVALLAAGACAASAAQALGLDPLRQQIRQLPADEVTPTDRQRLDVAAARLQLAERALARQAEAMTPRERVMAQVQLGIATERLKLAVTEQGGRSGLALSSAVRAADEASASAQRAPGSQRRSVTVRVSAAGPAGASPAPLEVYAVPLGVVHYVGTLSDAKLRNLLDLGRFAQRTSPATDELETGGDYAVWIAAPNRLEAVAQLLRQRGLSSYRKIGAQDVAPITLDFIETDQVRLPAATVSTGNPP